MNEFKVAGGKNGAHLMGLIAQRTPPTRPHTPNTMAIFAPQHLASAAVAPLSSSALPLAFQCSHTQWLHDPVGPASMPSTWAEKSTSGKNHDFSPLRAAQHHSPGCSSTTSSSTVRPPNPLQVRTQTIHAGGVAAVDAATAKLNTPISSSFFVKNERNQKM